MTRAVSPAHSSVEPMLVIYGLHTGDRRYRYIGLTTKGTKHRLMTHKNTAKRGASRTPVNHWLIAHNFDVYIDIIEECGSVAELYEREIYWIQHYRGLYSDLLNLSSGGDGCHGVKRSPETRARMSAARKGVKMTPQQVEGIRKGWINRDRTVSEETRGKISKSLLGNTRASGTPDTSYLTDEYKKRQSDHRRGKPNIGSHVRWHTNKGISKPETCKFCKEEKDTNDS